MKPKLRAASNLNNSTMGNRESVDYSTISPGPGKYSMDDLPKPIKGTTFGHAMRTSSIHMTSPGPGSYNIPTTTDENSIWSPLKHRFSIANRPEDVIDNENGPGQYEVRDSNFKKGYIPTRINRSFSPQKTAPRKQRHETPGPGSYFIPRELSQRGVIIPRSHKYSAFVNDSGMAGTNYYNYSSHKDFNLEYKAVTIGNSKRSSLPRLDHIPGPNQYSPNIFASKAKNDTGSFNREPRERFRELRNKSMEPGPGNYESPEARTKYPVTMKGRYNNDLSASKDIGPGPGSYHYPDPFAMTEQDKYQAEERARRVLLKKLKASSLMSSMQGDPNSGDASTITGGLSISKSLKSLPKTTARSTYMDQVLISKSPGPIYYLNHHDISTHLGEVGHAFPKSKKILEPERKSPGPGVYNTDVLKKETAKVKFTEAKRNDLLRPPQATEVPGAGMYDYKSDFDVKKVGGSMSKASRDVGLQIKRPKKKKQKTYIFESESLQSLQNIDN